MGTIKELTRGEAAKLCRLARRGDEKAFEKLYAYTLPLMRKYARRYSDKRLIGGEYDDFLQVLGMKLRDDVIESYDPKRADFGAFARVLFHRRAITALKSLTQPKQAKFAVSQTSYDATADGAANPIVTMLEDKSARSPSARAETVETREKVKRFIGSLSPLGRFVIVKRLKRMSYEEIAELLRAGVKGLERHKGKSLNRLTKVVDNALRRIHMRGDSFANEEPPAALCKATGGLADVR